ncbi:hypothetical protein [Niveibacterium sp. COAC-50]|uniref:hypothetical protein n=1 Tax=Niveibacterium sp. COAC-50 TaxID=2729384 RepID=UPI00155167A8|nr:hypothetical protein [Niveibacterium sp. COAC-50]
MDQAQRKAWIIARLSGDKFENIHEAWAVVGGEFNSLEGMPFGMKTRPNHIFTDFIDNRISGPESVRAFLEVVESIPDGA